MASGVGGLSGAGSVKRPREPAHPASGRGKVPMQAFGRGGRHLGLGAGREAAQDDPRTLGTQRHSSDVAGLWRGVCVKGPDPHGAKDLWLHTQAGLLRSRFTPRPPWAPQYQSQDRAPKCLESGAAEAGRLGASLCSRVVGTGTGVCLSKPPSLGPACLGAELHSKARPVLSRAFQTVSSGWNLACAPAAPRGLASVLSTKGSSLPPGCPGRGRI